MVEYAWAERGAPTRLQPRAAAGLLAAAYAARTGGAPSLPLLELMLAQIWLETDRTAAAWFFNWGNITPGAAWTGDVWLPPWYELTPESTQRHRDLHAKMLDGKAPRAFRVYPNAEAGMDDYVREVTKASNRAIIEAGELGDAEAYARAVRGGYCPDCSTEFGPALAAMRETLRGQGAFAGVEVSRSSSRSSRSSSALPLLVLGGILWLARAA